jgi:hypothetical protein
MAGRRTRALLPFRRSEVEAVSVEAGPSPGRPKPLFQTNVPAGASAYRTNYVPTRNGGRFLINTLSGDTAPLSITVVLNWTAGLKP